MENELWFGPQQPLANLSSDEAVQVLRNAGDELLADELASSLGSGSPATFNLGKGFFDSLLNRIVRTATVCGFLSSGTDQIVPVSQVKPDPGLRGKRLKIVLEGLHVAKYPGRGLHNILFDFAIQSQQTNSENQVIHYNAKFKAHDGETVPVRNFPLFYGFEPSTEGIVFGFQTINISSEFDEGLLGFLDRDVFKKGLALATGAVPVLGQISEMSIGLTKWLAGQSKNTKVQEFRQGLDLGAQNAAGLAEGTYIVVQIPLDYENEWDWGQWRIDPTLIHLVNNQQPASNLQFNQVLFSVRTMTEEPS